MISVDKQRSDHFGIIFLAVFTATIAQVLQPSLMILFLQISTLIIFYIVYIAPTRLSSIRQFSLNAVIELMRIFYTMEQGHV